MSKEKECYFILKKDKKSIFGPFLVSFNYEKGMLAVSYKKQSANIYWNKWQAVKEKRLLNKIGQKFYIEKVYKN